MIFISRSLIPRSSHLIEKIMADILKLFMIIDLILST